MTSRTARIGAALLGAAALLAGVLLLRGEGGGGRRGDGRAAHPAGPGRRAPDPAASAASITPGEHPSPVAAAAPRAAPTPQEQGDAAMVRAMGLSRPARTEVLDRLERHTQDELEFRASLARKTGRMPPPALDRLFEMQRAGASKEAQRAFAARELAAPVELGNAVERWIDAYDGSGSSPAAPPKDASRE